MQFTREDMARDFTAWRGGAPLHDLMTFTEAGLVLGRGALLATLEEDLGADGGFDEPRILALLAGAYGQPVSGDVIKKIRRASALWRAGDKGLAQIYLALAGLPRIGDWDAYRLHLARKLLGRGLGPAEVLKIMGCEEEARANSKRNTIRTSRALRRQRGRKRALDVRRRGRRAAITAPANVLRCHGLKG